jgi:hypothetical protein
MQALKAPMFFLQLFPKTNSCSIHCKCNGECENGPPTHQIQNDDDEVEEVDEQQEEGES